VKAVIQRVSSASVTVSGREEAAIGQGLLVLVGVEKGDTGKEAVYLARKIVSLRIFGDRAGKMNLAVDDPSVKGEVLAVSQFTLAGDVRKGRRPSFDRAEDPKKAEALFSEFVLAIREKSIPVKTGVFGAMMEIALVNDGPVTFVADSIT